MAEEMKRCFHTVRLRDYTPHPYRIFNTELRFILHPRETRVTTKLHVRAQDSRLGSIELDGDVSELVKLNFDGKALVSGKDYRQEGHKLWVENPTHKKDFVLESEVIINPEENKQLSGLYYADGLFVTQCEAEGFRRITYSIDRPDNLSLYTTEIHLHPSLAAASFPVLLSNGNRISQHTFQDPFPKPTYLFALVAGDLVAGAKDTFTTVSGRHVDLNIFVRRGEESKCAYAMDSLKRVMRFDEVAFGREYDLNIFNIVAVPSFNMGAMENKSLNIFNDVLILTRPDVATDLDYSYVESVVAHEYLHNWSGNRVTCRDWFQLSLKEGFTVFRDQEFSMSQRSAAEERVGQAGDIILRQFQEDSGPLAHPVRPEEYEKIDNFYTATVYEKGAEVIRMLQTLLGKEKFRQGCDRYFAKHDGTAATVEDFVGSMDLSDDLRTQFMLWYTQKGTPLVKLSSKYDAATKELVVEASQELLAGHLPQVIPIRLNLIGKQSKKALWDEDRIERLTQMSQTFRFTGVQEECYLSVFRWFSAPVKVEVAGRDADERAFLMAYDKDPTNRFAVTNQIQRDIFAGKISADVLLNNFGALLSEAKEDPSFTAMIMTLTSPLTVDADRLDAAALYREWFSLNKRIGQQYSETLKELLDWCKVIGPFRHEDRAKRALFNACLRFLVASDEPLMRTRALQEVRVASTMTTQIGALSALCQFAPEAEETKVALAFFRDAWKNEPIVLDKWVSVQAQSMEISHIEKLAQDPHFNLDVPNRVRSLVGAFAYRNFRFHSNEGYAFAIRWILAVDKRNPQTSARFCSAFESISRYTTGPLATEQLKALLKETISENLKEQVTRLVQ